MTGEIMQRFWEPFQMFGPKIPAIILGLVFGYIAIKVFLIFLKDAFKVARVPKTVINIAVSLISIVLWIILFSELAREAGLSSLAIKISGSLFVVGLALANGASAIASDVLAGIYLAKDKDFEVGFQIKTCEVEGVVERIDVRKTRLRDDKGCIHVLPNSKVDSSGWRVINRGEE